MESTTAQTIAAYGSVTGAVAASVAAAAAVAGWWRGRHRPAPDLDFDVYGWNGFWGAGTRDSYGVSMDSLYADLINKGDGDAHALVVTASGMKVLLRPETGPAIERLTQLALVRHGETRELVLIVETEDLGAASVVVTHALPGRRRRRSKPQSWCLADVRPEAWRPRGDENPPR